MRRFLIHMNYSGYNGFGGLMFLDEFQRLLKIGFDFSFFLPLEEVRRCSHKGFHHTHAVSTGAATGFLDLSFCLCPVFPRRCDKVKIQMRPARINVRVAGVFLFCTLVVRLNAGNFRPFVLGKTKNCILCSRYASLRFCQTKSYPNASASCTAST